MRTPVPRLLSSSPGCCWLPVIDYLMEWSVEQRTWFGEHRQHGGRNKPRTNRKEVKPALLFLWRRKSQRSRFPSRVIRRYCTAAVEPREEGRGEEEGRRDGPAFAPGRRVITTSVKNRQEHWEGSGVTMAKKHWVSTSSFYSISISFYLHVMPVLPVCCCILSDDT